MNFLSLVFLYCLSLVFDYFSGNFMIHLTQRVYLNRGTIWHSDIDFTLNKLILIRTYPSCAFEFAIQAHCYSRRLLQGSHFHLKNRAAIWYSEQGHWFKSVWPVCHPLIRRNGCKYSCSLVKVDKVFTYMYVRSFVPPLLGGCTLLRIQTAPKQQSSSGL